MLERQNLAPRVASVVLSAVAALMPDVILAQVGPPANTPIPAQFQDSYKVYLEMKAKAVAPKKQRSGGSAASTISRSAAELAVGSPGLAVR